MSCDCACQTLRPCAAQEQMLLGVLAHRGTAEDEDHSETWEEKLADVFVIDTEGHFARIGSGILRPQHVLHVTRKIKEALLRKFEAKGGLLRPAISRSEFASILNAGGISWLTQEQTEVIFSLIGGADEEAGVVSAGLGCRLFMSCLLFVLVAACVAV